jgi:hypothetical protein
MSPLFPELLAAHKLARKHDLQDALAACGLTQTGPMWGIAFVSVDPHHYAPSPGGKPAVIFPVFANNGDAVELVDLVACGLETRAIRTRCGVATLLGQPWLDLARATGVAARMFADPIEWLRNKGHGAVLLDMRAACFALADVPSLACETDRLARQIDNAMRQPPHLPQLFVRERIHAAA